MSRDETTAALLDWEQLNRSGPAPNAIRELIEAFLVTTEPILRELEQALQQHDEPAFHQLRHALAGAAKSVGATAIAATCQDLAQQRGLEPRLASVAKLRRDFPPTHAALVDFLARLPAATAAVTRVGTATKTLLVVEDNPTALAALRIDLSNRYQLLVAENGAAALALCAGETLPDVAIVDLNLGFSDRNGPSGLDVIHRLKDRVPVLVLTVDSSQEAVEAIVRAGAWVYLLKPADAQVLHANLELMLARAGELNTLSHYNKIDLATGLIMATHQLDQPEARRLIMTLAATQRRRASDLAEDLILAQGFHNTLARWAQRLSAPTDSPPP